MTHLHKARRFITTLGGRKMSMKEIMNDIALVDAVTRRFESLGYGMDDALKAATIAILSGEVIMVTHNDSETKDSTETNNNENTNPRFK